MIVLYRKKYYTLVNVGFTGNENYPFYYNENTGELSIYENEKNYKNKVTSNNLDIDEFILRKMTEDKFFSFKQNLINYTKNKISY